MTDRIPDVPVAPARRSLIDRVSVVWLVPFGALLIALGVAWQTWRDQGPLIEVLFDDAAGISANETELRYRDVAVGLVEQVRFTEGLDQVAVSIRLDKAVADYVDASAQFWVVRPEVSAQGISGLDTVLSGVYIEGLWATRGEGLVTTHRGLDAPPLLGRDEQGLRLILRASGGTLSGDSPIVYKGVEVGRIGPANVSLDGRSVQADAVIFSPYDSLVSEATRFWDTSGFSLSIGPGGASVDFDSLSSLVAGGVTFDTFVSGALLAEDGGEYQVFASREDARNSVFDTDDDGPELMLQAIFAGNVSGLSVGAAVELDGLRIGEVTGIGGIVVRTPRGDEVRLQALLSVRPARLGYDGAGATQAALDYLSGQVRAGLRARLATGNILTGGLKVQLVFRPDEPALELDETAVPYPAIPTTASDIVDVTATAQDTLDRINALPIEDILGSIQSLLDNSARLVGNEDTQAAPAELRAVLADIRAITGAEATQALPAQIGALTAELEATVAEANAILARLQAEDGVTRMLAAVDAAGQTATELGTAIDGLPALVEEITALAATARDLPLEDLVAQVTAVATDAQALVASEATQGLPGQIAALTDAATAAVADARGLLDQLDEAGGVDRLLAAVDASARVAASLDAALVDVPEVVGRINTLAANAETLDLAALAAGVQDVLDSADALLGAEATRALPAQIGAVTDELATALAELRGMIGQVQDQGGVERALAAIDSAAGAAASLDASLEGVPGIVARIDAIAAEAEGLELQVLADRIAEVLDSADAILATEAAQALPGQLGAALDELSAIMEELRAGGVIENANATFAAARGTLDDISAAAAELPGLIDRTGALITQIGTVVAGFGENSNLMRDVRAVLREARSAAEAVTRLARTIERNPNSLLLGR